MLLKRLKTFQVVVEEQNFSQAAIKLNYTQSTVSKHINSLEEELGTRLLVRKQGAYQLTEAGHKLFKHSLAIDKEMKGIDELSLNTGTAVTLTLQGHNYYCYEYLIPAIERFKSIYPHVNFIVKTSNNQSTVNQLIKNEIDIGIVSGNLMPTHFESHQIATESIGLCVGKNLYDENLTPEDYVSRYPIILDESDVYQTANIFPYIKQPLDIIDTDSDEVVHRALLRNKFVGVVRLGRLKEENNKGEVKVVEKVIKASPVNLVYNKDRKDHAYVSAFVSILRELVDPIRSHHIRFR